MVQGFDVMDPMFLFVGRLAVQKGPDLLLEAKKGYWVLQK